jgi:hypothetical protein
MDDRIRAEPARARKIAPRTDAHTTAAQAGREAACSRFPWRML